MSSNELAPSFAPFFGMMIFGCMPPPTTRSQAAQELMEAGAGAAYGTAKAGIGIAGIGTYRPDLIMKSLIPIVMSGILAVYSLVISVLIASDIKPPPNNTYSLYAGFMHMAAGLSVGLSGLAAGYAIGIVGDAQGVRSFMSQSRIFVGMVLILIFAEVLGLYGYVSQGRTRQRGPRARQGRRYADCTTTAHVLTRPRLIVALILNTRASG
ncbi:Vhypothetical proteintype proton ATPase 16 kDa proteolipid subunit 2 [Bipolaris maydis]|nr:Vhypothetical proteintype proton ATPase 16 kDa proteolipid subunit 2 [Bipolaris maydis]